MGLSLGGGPFPKILTAALGSASAIMKTSLDRVPLPIPGWWGKLSSCPAHCPSPREGQAAQEEAST